MWHKRNNPLQDHRKFHSLLCHQLGAMCSLASNRLHHRSLRFCDCCSCRNFVAFLFFSMLAKWGNQLQPFCVSWCMCGAVCSQVLVSVWAKVAFLLRKVQLVLQKFAEILALTPTQFKMKSSTCSVDTPNEGSFFQTFHISWKVGHQEVWHLHLVEWLFPDATNIAHILRHIHWNTTNHIAVTSTTLLCDKKTGQQENVFRQSGFTCPAHRAVDPPLMQWHSKSSTTPIQIGETNSLKSWNLHCSVNFWCFNSIWNWTFVGQAGSFGSWTQCAFTAHELPLIWR